MPTTVRGLRGPEMDALLTARNAGRLDALKMRAGLIFHNDAVPAAVATPNATDLPTSITLITALQVAYRAHIASACDAVTGQGAHIAADATNVLAAAVPTDLASCETAINEIKTQFNLHRVVAADHAVADSTNAVATTTAVDLATTEALANACKTALNAHVAASSSTGAFVITTA